MIPNQHPASLTDAPACHGAYFLASGLTAVCRPSELPNQVPQVRDLRRSLRGNNGLVCGPHRTKTGQKSKSEIKQILRLMSPFFFSLRIFLSSMVTLPGWRMSFKIILSLKLCGIRGRKKSHPTMSSPCKSRTFQNAGNRLGDFKGVQVQLHFIWGVN